MGVTQSDASSLPSDARSMLSDAGIQLGNTCCTVAEVAVDASETSAALLTACEAYAAALRLEADAMTHSNLGDALVRLPPPNPEPYHMRPKSCVSCGFASGSRCDDS